MSGVSCKTTDNCKHGAVCTMTYADDDKKIPLGRFCKGGKDPLGNIVNCKVNSDCPMGDCEIIRNKNGRFMGRQCIKDDKPVREGDYEDLNQGNKKYFYNRSVPITRINEKLKEHNAGPVAKIIVQLITLIIDIIKQAYSIGINIFWTVFTAVATALQLTELKGDLMFGAITRAHRDSGLCVSMWLIRNIFTIILPPYGVFMTVGFGSFKRMRKIIICCLLTSMFYFPGLVYALILVNNNNLATEERKYTKCLRERKSITDIHVNKFKLLDETLSDPVKTYDTDIFTTFIK
jgi:uncharacterized membrane protein YqaE (UPF0057 family)